MEAATITAFKQQYGSITVVSFGSGGTQKEFALRKPTRLEYRRARQLINDDKATDAYEAILQCVVYPDKVGLEAALDDQPALETRLADAVFELAGLRTPVEKKSF